MANYTQELIDHEDLKDKRRNEAMNPYFWARREADGGLCKVTLAMDYAALQAKLDAVMIEYCPDEMTPAQLDRWAALLQKSDTAKAK